MSDESKEILESQVKKFRKVGEIYNQIIQNTGYSKDEPYLTMLLTIMDLEDEFDKVGKSEVIDFLLLTKKTALQRILQERGYSPEKYPVIFQKYEEL